MPLTHSDRLKLVIHLRSMLEQLREQTDVQPADWKFKLAEKNDKESVEGK